MDEVVYVPVPRASLPAVYRLLADATSGVPLVETPADDPKGLPDPDLIRRMYRESYEGHKRLMAFLAASPDEWASTAEIAEALGVPNKSRGVAGMLGAFGRRSKNRYGHKKPWVSEWDGAREEAMHMMPAEVAEIVNSSLASD